MAVAQGYGKTVTSGSVFAYDTGDTRNSYIGEPTTNLALFSVTSGITFNADYAALTSQAADYNVTYRGRPSLRCTSTGQWNIYKYPRSGNYTATSSTAFTFSWKMKWSDGRVPAFSNGYIYTDAQYFYNAVSVTAIEDGWYFCQNIAGGTSSPIWLTGFTTTQYGTCYIADWQVEAKSHATSFTPAGTTRSATQGLLPLIGNSTLDLSNVSFDSNAQMTFDGTNDYIQTNLTGTYSQITYEFMGFFDDPTLSTTSRNESAFGDWISNRIHFGTRWSVGMHWNVNGVWNEIPNTNLKYGWNHYVLVWDNINNKKLVYLNGILSDSSTTNGSITMGDFKIGVATSLGAYYKGNINVFKIYNRALSAGEVRQNYLHYKTRFNLS